MDEGQIIQQYRSVFQRSNAGVIDLDEQLKMKCVFQLYRLETFISQVNTFIPPFRQSDYFIKLVRHGSGTMTIGHYKFPITDHLLTIVPPRVIQSSRYEGTTNDGFLLTFNLDFFLQNAFPKDLILNKRILRRSVRPYGNIEAEKEAALTKLFEYIEVERDKQLQGSDEMIAVKIIEILILVERCFLEQDSGQPEMIYDEAMERFDDLLEEHFKTQRSVGFYASAMRVHPNHLNHISKKITGRTAKQTIVNRVLLEAKYLLASSNLTIKEISYELGFDDPNYFVSFFKAHLKIAPSQYRLNPI
jgi:AraC family transcriptional regulator, transcriptional activator of pobA